MGNERKTGRKAAYMLVLKSMLFIFPVAAVVILYVADDPFMVLRRHDRYDSHVRLNEGYIGWKIYCNNRDSIHFNSFIMGNSCTMAYPCREWEDLLGSGNRAIRLFGNSESIMSILQKLTALEKEGAEIRNVLMILDSYSISQVQPDRNYGYILPPEVSGFSTFEVQMAFAQAFMMPDFLFPYLKFRLSGRIKPSMRYMSEHDTLRNPVNNDFINPRDAMIRKEGEGYWTSRPGDFPERSGQTSLTPKVIGARQEEILYEIASLLERNGTDVRIIISPDYNQMTFNPDDLADMERIFGSGRVFDFSGINSYTADMHNYYEEGHYRPVLGVKLMRLVYQQ